MANCLLVSVLVAILYNHYAQRKYQYNQLVDELDKQTEFKNSYLKEIKLLHQLDTKRRQELNHAKAEITKLADDLDNGTKQLSVKVLCAKSDNIIATAPAWMMQDSPNWRPDAWRNYFRLRRQLKTLETQYFG